ncbi:hypothetical protein WG66_005782 [Moniliophthora roreri]|nr:hypothetical protein WG66_005782 [Moniliophthora roreri]
MTSLRIPGMVMVLKKESSGGWRHEQIFTGLFQTSSGLRPACRSWVRVRIFSLSQLQLDKGSATLQVPSKNVPE